MASPLVTVQSALETEWEALTPPDRTAITYRHTEGQDTNKGFSGDRVFWFDVPSDGTATDERGAVMTEYVHAFVARVRLISAGYTQRTLFNRVANEAALLIRAVDKKSENTWGSGIINVITDGYTTERGKEEVILSINIRAFTQETD